MGLYPNRVCPHCKKELPALPLTRNLIWRGYGESRALRCANCGELCASKVVWALAAKSWPVAAVFFGLCYLAGVAGGVAGWYGSPLSLLCVPLFVLCFVVSVRAYNAGVEMVPLDQAPSRNRKVRAAVAFGFACAFILIFALFGFLTRDWQLAVGYGICHLVAGTAAFLLGRALARKSAHETR